MPPRALALAVLLAGCPSPSPPDAGTPDAGEDAGTDAAIADAGPSHCAEGTDEDRPPTFAGLQSATADGPQAAILRWRAAADDHTPLDRIRYRVFVAAAGAPLDLATPLDMVRGAETIRIAGLATDTPHRFVVRAEDEAGQRDCNSVEVTATPTPITGCVDYATWIQPIFDAHCLTCHGADEPRRGLRLEDHAAVLAGGETGAVVVPCRPERSLLHHKVSSDTPPQGLRMPRGGVPLNDAQLARIALWIEQGALSSCPEDPTVCADRTPPTFAGAERAEPRAGELEVCWGPATDDATASGALRYAVYLSTGAGTAPPAWTPYVSAPGASCLSVGGLAPGQRYCAVVRARDEASNEDANLVERCADTPAEACIDFARIGPLLERECVHCHGGPEPQNALDLGTYAGVVEDMRGYVVACDAPSSFLVQKLLDPPAWGFRMPADGPPYLAPNEIVAIERWIELGARRSCADPDPCASP